MGEKKKLHTKFWSENMKGRVKVKLCRYTPWRHMGGEEV
jgi:hypothetical protein